MALAIKEKPDLHKPKLVEIETPSLAGFLPNFEEICPRCGGRLFLGQDTDSRRLCYIWECQLGCSRRYSISGELIGR